MTTTLKPILTVLGYVLGAAAGVAAIWVGVTQPEIAFVVIGVAFLAAVLVAFIAGATASPTGALPPNVKFGGKFTPPDWAWYVSAGILVVGLVIGGVLLAL